MQTSLEHLSNISKTYTPLWSANSVDRRSFVVPAKIEDLLRFMPSLEGKSATEKAVLSSHIFDEMALINRHTWLRKGENIFSWAELVPFLYASRAVTGLCEGFSDIWNSEEVDDKELKRFLKALESHVKAVGAQLPFKKTGVSMGFVLEVMVPTQMEDLNQLRDVAEMALRTLDYTENGTFFVRHYHKQNGNYLGIFVTPRQRFACAQDIVISRANKARYRSRKTGKMCKESARDAVLVCKKGDVLKTMKAWFSESHDFLDVSQGCFREVVSKTKAILSDVFDMLGFSEDKRIILGEYDGNGDNWTDYNKKVIMRYNKAFFAVEKELNDIYEKVLDKEEGVRMLFKDLVINLRRMQRNVVTRKEEISRNSDILVRFDAPYIVTKKAIEYMKTRMMQKVFVFEQSVGILEG